MPRKRSVSPKKFLRALLLCALGTLAVVAIGNLLIDPYGIYAYVAVAGVNLNKPEQRFHDRLHKAHVAAARPARSVLLGTSRTQVGLDASSPVWDESSAGPALNLALSGGTPYEALRYLQHAHAFNAVHTAIMGLDFLSFDVEQPSRNPEFAEERMAKGRRDWIGRHGWWLYDLGPTTLSFSALAASIRTVMRQRQPSYFDAAGSRTSHHMRKRLLELGGAGGNFRASETQYRQELSQYRLARADGATPTLDALRAIIEFAARNDIRLIFFFSPSHARDLMLLRKMGYWPLFEQWKAKVVDLAGRDAVVWDFTGANAYTSEVIPTDPGAEMIWYWESSHYKTALGDIILRRALNLRGADENFGVRLTPENLAREQWRINTELAVYERRDDAPDEQIESGEHLSAAQPGP